MAKRTFPPQWYAAQAARRKASSNKGPESPVQKILNMNTRQAASSRGEAGWKNQAVISHSGAEISGKTNRGSPGKIITSVSIGKRGGKLMAEHHRLRVIDSKVKGFYEGAPSRTHQISTDVARRYMKLLKRKGASPVKTFHMEYGSSISHGMKEKSGPQFSWLRKSAKSK